MFFFYLSVSFLLFVFFMPSSSNHFSSFKSNDCMIFFLLSSTSFRRRKKMFSFPMRFGKIFNLFKTWSHYENPISLKISELFFFSAMQFCKFLLRSKRERFFHLLLPQCSVWLIYVGFCFFFHLWSWSEWKNRFLDFSWPTNRKQINTQRENNRRICFRFLLLLSE